MKMTMLQFGFGFMFYVVAAVQFSVALQTPAIAQDSAAVSITSSGEALPEAITNSVGMKLVPISAGRFSMGSPASERGSQEDEVLHKVELTQSFHMGATEVTEHQWAMVMEEPFRTELVEVRDPDTNRLIKKEERQIKNPKLDSELPITKISWSQAVEFCKRLGQLPEEKKEGRKYRLPTEAEWEYACRAGTSSAYSFGDDLSYSSQSAWHQGNANKAMPVAAKQPNAWGLYDMHGNVFEWCHDCYGKYQESLAVDPDGHDTLISQQHVVRGGSFQSKLSQCRSASRLARNGETVGLRVVVGGGIPGIKIESVVNSIGQRLVLVPQGSFQMGSEEGGRPVHEVRFTKPHYMMTTEVTQAQWTSVMGTSPWKSDPYRKTIGDDYPATHVSWNDAVEYCRRLSSRPEERTAGRVYRLPTESEWEHACRAESKSEFYFGNELEDFKDFGWCDRTSPGGIQIVGQKQPNYWGLYDMHGNVWEWCSDWYGDYPSETVTDPQGSGSGSERVFRGGAFNEGGSYCRSAYRYADLPTFRSGNLGFRMVMHSQSK